MKMIIIQLLMIMKKIITITLIMEQLTKQTKVTLKITQKKSVYIVGDSMVKEVNGFQLLKSIKHKYSVRIRFHPSAKTSCINDHVKPVNRNQEADHIFLHTGTNGLSSDKTLVLICIDIVNLAASIKDKDIKVTISEIVERNDALNNKVVLVNKNLSKICKSIIGLSIIKHHKIKPDFHLNQTKFHLNKKGNTIFVSNFRRYLSNLNKQETLGGELTVYSGKTKSFEYLNSIMINQFLTI